MSPSLRPYQTDLLERGSAALSDCRAIVLGLPTGGGKTMVIGAAAEDLVDQGASLWVTAHREELIDQISDTFHNFDIGHGIIKSGMPQIKHPVQVGMIQTLKNRLQKLSPPDFVFIDECHHTPASQYDYLIQSMPKTTKIIGVTATPCRLDGKGLDKHYNKLVLGPTMSELISLGYLVPAKCYGPQLVDTSNLSTKFGDYDSKEIASLMDDPRIVGDAIEHYRALAPGKSAVAFCSSIAASKETARRFTAAGIPAAHLDGTMDKPTRKRILDSFRKREVLVLCNRDIISEGFDCPGIEAIIMLRPTKSLSLFLQMIGRALRLLPGKEYAIIIDHVGNCVYHDYPRDDFGWTLAGLEKRKKEKGFEVKTCRVCYEVYRGNKCPSCLITVLGGSRQPLKEVAGQLQEFQASRTYLTKDEITHLMMTVKTSEDARQYAYTLGIDLAIIKKVLTRVASNYDELLHVGRIMDYKEGWAKHKAEGRHYTEPEDQMRIAL